MAITGLVSTTLSEPLIEKLYECGMKELVDESSSSLNWKEKVFVNGDWLGVCGDASSFVTKLKSKRRRNEVPCQVLSLSFNSVLK